MRFLVAVLYKLAWGTEQNSHWMLSWIAYCSSKWSQLYLHFYQRLHEDVIKRKNFPGYWPCVRGSHLSSVNSPNRGQWRGALLFYFIYAWKKGRVKNREAGDLGRHHAHYDVMVMLVNNCYNEIFFRLCMKLYFKLTDEHIWSVLHN